MDYLTIGLIVISVILLIVALIMLYGAKTKSGTTTRSNRIPRLFGVALSDVPDELYNPNKINSAIGLVWAALVLAVLAGISAAIKKKPLAARALTSLGERFTFRTGAVPAAGLTVG